MTSMWGLSVDEPEREEGETWGGRNGVKSIAMEHKVKQDEDGKAKLLLPLWGWSEVAKDKDTMRGGWFWWWGCDPHGCVPAVPPAPAWPGCGRMRGAVKDGRTQGRQDELGWSLSFA